MAGKITRTEVVDCDCSVKASHGDPHVYNYHKCGCTPCRESYRQYRKVREYNKKQGKGQILPIGPTRDYILNLKARGMPYSEIASRAGMHKFAIHRIHKQQVTGISRKNARAIRSIPLPSKDFVDRKKK